MHFHTLRIFHTPHFPHSAFSILRIFHTPHFPHSSFSILLIFHTPHSALRTPHSALRVFHPTENVSISWRKIQLCPVCRHITLTIPCKCKLTVSTRNSILEAIENRVSSIEVRASSFEYRVSRRSKNFSRISMVAFEETINFSNLKQ